MRWSTAMKPAARRKRARYGCAATLQRYPKQRLAWQRLQQILEHTQQLQEETGVWARMGRHFAECQERMQWAETHWNLFDPRQAWKVLPAWIPARSASRSSMPARGAGLGPGAGRRCPRRLRAHAGPGHPPEQQRRGPVDRPVPGQQSEAGSCRCLSAVGSAAAIRGAWPAPLQLAENLHDWPALKSLLAEAEGLPEAQGSPYYWVARARLAEQEGHGDVAERLYREALVRFPGENLVRERLLWFYIDRGRRDSLAPLLAQWHGLALRDSTLWLPFASASLLLERNDQALAWFRLYLKSNPNDWLVQAAYADALMPAATRTRPCACADYCSGGSTARRSGPPRTASPSTCACSPWPRGRCSPRARRGGPGMASRRCCSCGSSSSSTSSPPPTRSR